MFNLSIILKETAQNFSQKEALVWGEKRLTFKELNEFSDRFAAFLNEELKIVKGDKVAISCLNNPQFVIAYYGILKTGATAVTLSALLNEKEIERLLVDSHSKVYCCYEGIEGLPLGKIGRTAFQSVNSCEHFIVLDDDWTSQSSHNSLASILQSEHQPFKIAATAPEDTALIMYTSGTTGLPKGTEISHFNLFINASVGQKVLRYRPNDKNIIALPISHIFAHTMQLNAGILNGNTSILISKFNPLEMIETIVKEQPSIFCGVPTMFWALANYPCSDDIIDEIKDALRICVSGGAPLPEALQKTFEDKFHVSISEIFGMTESSGCVCFNYYPETQKTGTIGPAVWGMEVAIFDENDKPLPVGEKGELVFRGHSVMKGYLNQKIATDEALANGWMHSGDIAYMDEDGFVYIVDRIKEMIIRGGWKVYPREVEEILMKHPSVNLVAVIGVPHEKYGEEIKAIIIKEKDVSVTKDGLIDYCKEHLAKYKYPRIVEFVKELPLSKTGKILKKNLK